MILRPPTTNDAGIQEILVRAGLVKTARSESAKPSAKELINEILDDNGATMERAAAALADALSDETQRLRAAELLFKVRGIMKEGERPNVPSVTINIVGGTSQQTTILDLVSPQT